MTIYTDVAAAKDELRRAKDHEQTMRAIAEYCELSGKNADDRKRELAFVLSQDQGWRKAVDDLRDCELAVDRCQAAIDQADAERRDREWKIRARLADALREHTKEPDDFDGPTIDQITKAIQDIAQSRDQYAGVAREMLDAYNSGMAERINGAGEFEPDDEDEDDGMSHGNLESEWYAGKRRPKPTYSMLDDLYPTK